MASWPSVLGHSRACDRLHDSDDLARGGVQRDPEPLLIRLLLHKAPPRIGFGCQPSQHPIRGMMWHPAMEVSRTGGQAVHHTMQQPGQADTHGAADAAEREALPPQVVHHL